VNIIARLWKTTPIWVRRAAIAGWCAGAVLLVAGVLLDRTGWTQRHGFLVNVMSSLVAFLMGVPVAVIAIGTLSDALSARREAFAIVNRCERDVHRVTTLIALVLHLPKDALRTTREISTVLLDGPAKNPDWSFDDIDLMYTVDLPAAARLLFVERVPQLVDVLVGEATTHSDALDYGAMISETCASINHLNPLGRQVPADEWTEFRDDWWRAVCQVLLAIVATIKLMEIWRNNVA
jgi:hypothetical protein